MRLKFLFFPLMLILSLFVIVMYIWPEIEVIREGKKQYAESARTLASIKSNQANIQSRNADLASNGDKYDVVMAYLPQAKSEERIVDSLNYLATGAGLSVVNIGLDKSAPVAAAPVAQAVPLTSLAGQDANPASTQDGTAAVNSLNISSVSAHVTVTGEYEKILMYTDQIQKMGMDNVITKMEIASKKADTTSTAGGQSQSQEGSSLLSATIAINFAYAPQLKNARSDSANLASAHFDFAPVEKLSALIAQGGAPGGVPGIEIGATGKANPFLP